MPRSIKKGPFVDLHLLKKVEQAVSNILLRHSAGPVQLHDVRPGL